jgi:integrase
VTDRVEDLVELFITEYVSKTRSARKISRLLRREVIPCWGLRSVHEISRRHVIELVTEVAARGTPSAANKLLKVVKTFLGWCMGARDSAAQVRAPTRERARDRVLDDDELARIIRAVRQINGPYGDIVELLALTGQRREEVAQVSWEELDLASQSSSGS